MFHLRCLLVPQQEPVQRQAKPVHGFGVEAKQATRRLDVSHHQALNSPVEGTARRPATEQWIGWTTCVFSCSLVVAASYRKLPRPSGTAIQPDVNRAGVRNSWGSAAERDWCLHTSQAEATGCAAYQRGAVSMQLFLRIPLIILRCAVLLFSVFDVGRLCLCWSSLVGRTKGNADNTLPK